MKLKVSPWIIVAVLVVAAVGVKSLMPKAPVEAKTAQAARKTLDLTVSSSGKIEAQSKTQVGSLLSGKVAEVFVEEGNVVAVGDPLFELESEDLALALEQANLNAQIARMNANNALNARRVAEATYNKVAAGARAEELAVSQATLNQYQSGIDAANRAIGDIEDLNESSNDLAENAVEQAEEALDAADQAVEDAQAAFDLALDSTATLTELQIMGYEAALHQAEANQKAAELALDAAELAETNTERIGEQAENTAESALDTAVKTYAIGKAQLDLAKAGASTYDKQIYSAQLASAREQYNIANVQSKAAASAVRGAELQFGRATVQSPLAGIVATVNVKKGELVLGAMPGTAPLVLIVNMGSMKFIASADETDVNKLQAGQKVNLDLDAYPDGAVKAEVEKVGVMPVPTEGGATAYKVTIGIRDENVEGLKEGMNGEANTVIGTAENILVIPATALMEESGKSFVYLVKADKSVTKKEVKTGRVIGSEIEITGGLNEGDAVVDGSLDTITEGDRIK